MDDSVGPCMAALTCMKKLVSKSPAKTGIAVLGLAGILFVFWPTKETLDLGEWIAKKDYIAYCQN